MKIYFQNKIIFAPCHTNSCLVYIIGNCHCDSVMKIVSSISESSVMMQ